MNEAAASRTIPAPQISPENRAFWEAANQGRLLLPFCRDCDRPHWYPRPLCPRCFSDRIEWRPSVGRGTVYSFTHIVGSQPFIVAYVRLDEGVTMLSNVVHCGPGGAQIGQAVRLAFAAAENGQAVPVFEPA